MSSYCLTALPIVRRVVPQQPAVVRHMVKQVAVFILELQKHAGRAAASMTHKLLLDCNDGHLHTRCNVGGGFIASGQWLGNHLHVGPV